MNKNILIFAAGEFGRKIIDYLFEHYPNDYYFIVILENSELRYHLESFARPNVTITEKLKNNSYHIPNGIEFEFGICAWWPLILPKEIINIPRAGILNIHPSLLPLLKGKHTSFWAIVEEKSFGVTIHKLDESIDGGPILVQKSIPVDWESTGGTLALEAQKHGYELFCEHYPRIRLGDFLLEHQPVGQGCFHHSSEIVARSKLNLNKKVKVRDLLNLLRAKTHPDHLGCTFDDGNHSYEVKVQIRKIEKL